MARFLIIDDDYATGRLREVYERVREQYRPEKGGRIPQIAKAMSFRPDFLAGVMDAAKTHFSEGSLSRVQHEMLAIYVAALNGCDYCRISHMRLLGVQGDPYSAVARALGECDLSDENISSSERKLLEFAGAITKTSNAITDEYLTELLQAGWTEPQLAEAIYITAFFNMIVRIANAFGLRPSMPDDKGFWAS